MTRMPLWKPYDHAIDFMEDAKLPKPAKVYPLSLVVSQTSFGHISINSLMILMVSKAIKSPQKDLFINASHISRQSILAKILSRSTSSHYVTIY